MTEGAMRTARECLLKAQDCEDLARACIDPINQDMLFDTGQYWRQLASETSGARRMPSRFNPTNRSVEYRQRAEQMRAQADDTTDDNQRRTLLEMADTWERMAKWEDEHNPPRSVPGPK